MPSGGKRANTGGKREGAGRKSKAEELGLPALIDQVIDPEAKKKLIQTLYKQAKNSFPHLQLLMGYMYGKPKETISQTNSGDILIRVVRE